MATEKLFTRINLESQTTSLGDNLINILQKIKSIAVIRAVVEGSNHSAEHDWLLTELDRTEAEIKKLISRCDTWIQSNKNDISKLEKQKNILPGKAGSKQGIAKNMMIAEKKSEIKFLEMQSKRLKEYLNILYAKENNRYRYRYRVVERQAAAWAYSGADQIKNIESIKIKALDSKNLEKGHISANVKENGRVYIVWTEADPPGQGTGYLIYKSLESLFAPGTVIYFKENKSPLFWLKMGFRLKPFDGETKSEFYWKKVS